MKAITLKTLTKNICIGIFAIMIVFLCNSCAVNYSFLTSSVVPAARGSVKVKRDNNKNWVIQIKISNLAEVTRLQPSKQTYVVWMVTDPDITKNVGQLKSSTSFLSKQLTGSFETVSSSKPTKIFITAENDPGTQYPDMQIILSTDRFQQ
jgi:hypothetical protein